MGNQMYRDLKTSDKLGDPKNLNGEINDDLQNP